MKRFKRVFSIIAASILIVCFALPLDILAATPGSTTTIDATYRCYKGSDVGTAGTAPIGDSHYYWHYNADGTSLNCPIRFMKESGTGRPIYCIEVGATFGGGYSYSTRELEDSPYWTSLSSTARAGITYTTMYGYPVNNYGHRMKNGTMFSCLKKYTGKKYYDKHPEIELTLADGKHTFRIFSVITTTKTDSWYCFTKFVSEDEFKSVVNP